MKYHIIIFLSGLLIVWSQMLLAQQIEDDKYQMSPNSEEIEANFLSGYYQQDGNNSAVTGGIGTEALNNMASILTINIPLDSINSVGFYGGADIYTSASTDRIDDHLSGASKHDTRGFGTLSYSRKNLKRNETFGVRTGFSTEYDYTSFTAGLAFTKEWNEGNSELSIVGQGFFDKWKIIYPMELRGSVSVPSSGRQSFNGLVNFSQVLNKRMHMSLSTEVVVMKGLLSTPFHRVYFQDQEMPDIERLPDSRIKVPIGLRLNYFPTDNLIIRSYYRYYWDDLGITASTAELEVPLKLSYEFTLSPFYRYHRQTEADYFAPYRLHLSSEQFYTSDYDLSALKSHKYGFGVKYSPLYGLTRSKPLFKDHGIFMLKYLEMRAGYYHRSTSLKAWFASLNLGMTFK